MTGKEQKPETDITEHNPEAVMSLINNLNSKDRSVRKKAAGRLTSMGEPAVGALVRALADSRKAVRWEAGKILEELQVDWTIHADAETIRALIKDLGSNDGLVRVRARKALVMIGEKAVTSLVEALASENVALRWESAKALCEIGDPDAIDALLRALEDDRFDVRWVAGEGLIAIGRKALKPLLQKLAEDSDSLEIREGAHRVLHGIADSKTLDYVKPVLKALEDSGALPEIAFVSINAAQSLEANDLDN